MKLTPGVCYEIKCNKDFELCPHFSLTLSSSYLSKRFYLGTEIYPDPLFRDVIYEWLEKYIQIMIRSEIIYCYVAYIPKYEANVWLNKVLRL